MTNQENIFPQEYIKQETLKQELDQRCKSVIGSYGITVCGEASPNSPKPWIIQRNGESLYFTVEEGIEYLEELSKEHKS